MHEIKTERYKGFLPLRLALALLAVAALVILISWQMKIIDKRAELATLQEQIVTQDTRNREIRKTVDALEEPEGLKQYAEQKAREELDYGKPGERIFVDVGGGD